MAARRIRELIEPGKPAPDFRMARLEGGESTLQDVIANGPSLLVFFKISCPICQLTLPYLDRISAGKLPIYSISQNDAEDTRDFNREFRLTLPTLLDSEDDDFPASNAFGISMVPTMFLVERDGTVSRVIEGWRKQELQWLGDQAGVQPFGPRDNPPEWKAG